VNYMYVQVWYCVFIKILMFCFGGSKITEYHYCDYKHLQHKNFLECHMPQNLILLSLTCFWDDCFQTPCNNGSLHCPTKQLPVFVQGSRHICHGLLDVGP